MSVKMHSLRELTVALALAASVLVQAQDSEGVPAGGQREEADDAVTHGIPGLCEEPTVVSARSGNWSDPAMWSKRKVPSADDKVRILPGMTVIFDALSDAPLQCIDVAGSLTFRPDASTRLTVGTLKVLEGGTLSIGTERAPVVATVTAELIIANREIDPLDDVEQFGTGLIGLGTVRMHGSVRNPTFVRVTSEPLAGQKTLQLEQPVSGWGVGDKLVLPDTRQLQQGERGDKYKPQWEELTIAAVAGDLITLAAPLAFHHRGARDGAGVLEFLPHVGNLSRNIIVRSAEPNGTRGHVLFSGRADVDIRYVLFKNLGRTRLGPLNSVRYDAEGIPRNFGTNQTGRYALHFHHVSGPEAPPANGYQFTVIGNAVEDGPKWGITVRDSHYGLIKDNIVYNAGGAAIVTEGGSESSNTFDHNFVLRSQGWVGLAPAGDAVPGGEGAGFWLRGPNNILRNNVVANVDVFGYAMAVGALGKIQIPKFKGADPSKKGEFTEIDTKSQPLQEFAGNEAYGAIQTGVAVGWNGTMNNTRLWHVWRYAATATPADRLLIDGLVVRGDATALKGRFENAMGIWITNYAAKIITIRNVNIQGMRAGIASPFFASHLDSDQERGDGIVTIENSYFRDYVGVAVATSHIANAPGIPVKKVVVRNSQFEELPGVPLILQQPAAAISLNYGMSSGDLARREPIIVQDFNKIPGDTFRVFYSLGLPASAAPCGTSRADIVGFVCSGVGPSR